MAHQVDLEGMFLILDKELSKHTNALGKSETMGE